jgi:hypothetical protein
LIAEGHSDSSRELLVTWDAGGNVEDRAEPEIARRSILRAVTDGWTSSDMQVSGPDFFVGPKTKSRDLRDFRPASLRGRQSRAKRARIAMARANHPSMQPRIYLVDDEELETTRISLRRAFEDSAAATTPGSPEWVTG